MFSAMGLCLFIFLCAVLNLWVDKCVLLVSDSMSRKLKDEIIMVYIFSTMKTLLEH